MLEDMVNNLCGEERHITSIGHRKISTATVDRAAHFIFDEFDANGQLWFALSVMNIIISTSTSSIGKVVETCIGIYSNAECIYIETRKLDVWFFRLDVLEDFV